MISVDEWRHHLSTMAASVDSRTDWSAIERADLSLTVLMRSLAGNDDEDLVAVAVSMVEDLEDLSAVLGRLAL